MKITTKTLKVLTKSQFEFVDITEKIKAAIVEAKVKNGFVNVFAKHTTAAIRINQNEPLLVQDIMRLLYKLVPLEENYSHDLFEIRKNMKPDERSNGHAHCKQILLGASECIPIKGGKMELNPRQSIFLAEFDGGRKREVIVQIVGE